MERSHQMVGLSIFISLLQMSKFRFTRREKIILMIVGILLALRLILTLIIFGCYPCRNFRSLSCLLPLLTVARS